MPDIKIDFVKKDKDKLIKLVEPNLTYNRFDEFYDNQYELIEIKTEDKNWYVPVHIEIYTAKLGVYMTKLPQEAFDKLIEFIFKLYPEVDFIEIQHSLNSYKTHNGIIKRTKGKRMLIRALFQFGQNDSFYFLRLFGIKFKKRKRKENCPLEINQNTKCLMVCPHPDDEILGAGALMIKYSDNFDCICMGSSGIATPDINAKDRSALRIKEFHEVMETIGVKNRWIFETYGVPRFDRQMDAHFDEYCKTLKNLKDYDYIFLPHPSDGHHEHRFITNKLFKRIAKKVGINPNTKIVFYEVWKDMKSPNVFFDTSTDGFLYSKHGFKKQQKPYSKLLGTTDETLLELKCRILNMYKSQWYYNSAYSVQTMRTKCINNGKNPIWRFRVINIKKYLN